MEKLVVVIPRASELQTPHNPAVFEEFGQSIVKLQTMQTSTPPLLRLYLLNGTFYGALFNKESPLMKKLSEAIEPQGKLKFYSYQF